MGKSRQELETASNITSTAQGKKINACMLICFACAKLLTSLTQFRNPSLLRKWYFLPQWASFPLSIS